MSRIDVHGTVADGYEQVREAIAAGLAEQDGQVDAQLSAYVSGRRVVDLWAGDEVSGDTLTGVYSSTEGAATLVVALLVQEQILDLDVPAARHWPEFAAAGKATITLRDVMSHRSGVIGVDGGLSADELADDAVIGRRLAGQRPYWRPGSAYGYGGFVSFAIVSELIRRVTGRSLQQHYDERIRLPYGLDLYLGLPEAEEERFRPIQRWMATPEQGGRILVERAGSAQHPGHRVRAQQHTTAGPGGVRQHPDRPGARSGVGRRGGQRPGPRRSVRRGRLGDRRAPPVTRTGYRRRVLPVALYRR